MDSASVAGSARQVRRRRVGALTLIAGLPLVLAACTSGSPSSTGSNQNPSTHAQGSPTSSPTPTPSKVSQVKITVTPAPDTRAVKPTARVEVRADDGRVDDVILKTTTGRTVQGALGTDGVWRSRSGLLPYATTFTVTAHGVDSEGLGRQISTQFTTVRPRQLLTTSISPLSGSVVGVGMPIIVRLSAPVSHRAAVEQRLVVTSSKRAPGAWTWVSDSELHWRPKTYWPAGTDVKLAVNLTGVHAGDGLWGDESRVITFHVGDAMISTVDVSAHRMTITRNGVVLRVVPITTGKAGFVTREGIKVILSKERSRIMDAATINIPKNSPNYYRLKVFWAMRVTWSGEFVHAAPWSQASQGLANVSHGCTGMSMANAEWFYNLTTVGDVVKFIHSPRPLEPGNGWTDWNVPWSTWLKGDALRSA